MVTLSSASMFDVGLGRSCFSVLRWQCFYFSQPCKLIPRIKIHRSISTFDMAFLAKCFTHWNSKLVLLLLTIACAASIILYLSGLSSSIERADCPHNRFKIESKMEPMEEDVINNFEPMFQERLVHLDLKGAPPKLEYFAQIFPLFSKLGATGLLIEYEDMFPYSGPLKSIVAGNAYDEAAIAKINSLAKENKLEIIPLIQTFGHMEFLLKFEEHVHLREDPEQPQAICPSHNETLPLLFLMLSQVAQLHPDSKRIHIGADEVYFIGRCKVCMQRMTLQAWSTPDLFIDHVSQVATFVRDKLNKRAMMWDDEFRTFSEPQLLRSGIGALVDIVVWNYQPVHQLSREVWNKYLNVFDNIWAASAFKGASGSDQILTPIRYHLDNHRAWIGLVSEYRDTSYYSKFKGIMITGWQRYDHFAVLCELLPVSIPSLSACLLLLQHGNTQKTDQEASRLLDCSGGIIINSDPYQCRFPGVEVLRAVEGFKMIKEQYLKLLNDSVVRGWLSDYNVAHKFTAPHHLERISNELGYLQNNLESFQRECGRAMDTVYDEHTSSEWIETHVKPLRGKVEQLMKTTESLRSVNTWPRRPLVGKP